ncbi:hypothetical protein Bca52824_082354 [Brassica carinata]|uniref:Uncharacterized protein n=1 Tax=Brassica carinata TaxID=52824 RepID=A0A8X7PKH4_BRACI|nr:hypothetical protein Bca52824_082354 [Brassica carinata]
MADHYQKEQDKLLFDYFIELRFTMILVCRRRSCALLKDKAAVGGNHLDGRQLLGPRSEVSDSIMSNRFSGNKRSNSDSQFTAQDHPETLHWSKMLRNGPGSLSMNMNHMANQPPRGGGGQISHFLHQLSSSRFKDENVVPSVISQTAADEGSRTGMKGPGLMSPFTMPNPSRFECFTPSRRSLCDSVKFICIIYTMKENLLCVQYKVVKTYRMLKKRIYMMLQKLLSSRGEELKNLTFYDKSNIQKIMFTLKLRLMNFSQSKSVRF